MTLLFTISMIVFCGKLNRTQNAESETVLRSLNITIIHCTIKPIITLCIIEIFGMHSVPSQSFTS